MERPDSFEFSKLEIQELTGWPDSLVEDYRNIGTAINELFDGLQTPAGNVTAPATATSAGTAGMIAYDNNFIYVCIAASTWKRSPITTWQT